VGKGERVTPRKPLQLRSLSFNKPWPLTLSIFSDNVASMGLPSPRMLDGSHGTEKQ
jgi:hypothetical protein